MLKGDRREFFLKVTQYYLIKKILIRHVCLTPKFSNSLVRPEGPHSLVPNLQGPLSLARSYAGYISFLLASLGGTRLLFNKYNKCGFTA